MKKFLSLLLVTLPIIPTMAQETANNGAVTQKTWYGQELFLDNIRYGANNPASTAFNPYSVINSVELGYYDSKGSFRAIDGASEDNQYNMSVYGAKKISKVSFEGKIDYFINDMADSRWNNTALISEHNPFIIADSLYYLRKDGSDSIPNNQNREIFNLTGTVTYQLSDKLLFGIKANYKVANKSDQSDPRFLTNAARITITPGMEFKTGLKHTIGFSANLEGFHEHVSATVEDNIYPEHTSMFLFTELGGLQTQTESGYTRWYNGKKIGGDLSSVFTGSSFSNFAEAGGYFNFEEALDGGSSYTKHGGDYKEFEFHATDRMQFGNGSLLHNVILKADMIMGSGKTFKHTTTFDKLGNTIYEVASGSVTHKENNIQADLTYRLDLMKENFSTFTAQVNGGINMVSINQYPDEYYAKYTMANAGFSVSKRWKENKFRYSVNASGNYVMPLSELDIFLPNATAVNKKFGRGYFRPKYEFFAAEHCNAGISADVSYPIIGRNGSTYWIKGAVEYNLDKYLGEYYRFDDRQSIAANLSLTF